MKIALLVLMTTAVPHPGWDMIAVWKGPGWYAEVDRVPIMGPLVSKRQCKAQIFDQPSTCRYFRKKSDFPEPLPIKF